MRKILREEIDKKEYLFRYAFSIDVKFENELNNIKFPIAISGDLIDEFKDNNCPLSPYARVIRKENEWVIEDRILISIGKSSTAVGIMFLARLAELGVAAATKTSVEDIMFLVRKEEGKLNIYKGRKTGGKEEEYCVGEFKGYNVGEVNGYNVIIGLEEEVPKVEYEDRLKAIISSDDRFLFGLGKPKSEEYIDLLGLRGELEKHNLHFSSEAYLIPVSKDLLGIVDREKIYKIKKMGEQLGVYAGIGGSFF